MSRLNGIFAKLSPRALNTQVAVSQHSQAKKRSEQVGSSSEDGSPVSMRRRPRPRRIITPEADQDSISSMQGSRQNIGIDKAFTREAFDETLSRWSSFAPTGGEYNAGNNFAELEDCEKELRRLEESLKLAQRKHNEIHRQIEAIDQLIAVATPGQNEGDAAGIGRRRGEIWAPLLATAERTREALEVEAREEVERLSTAVAIMRADVARLTDEAELQRLVKEVAKGMKDISKLMEKRR
ncbi:hypothetical protein CGCSCA1_v013036 [Colletotrichum siamense]|nr:hypothetical protein CGCSCA1_v013036 [Colletotrichum siamense]